MTIAALSTIAVVQWNQIIDYSRVMIGKKIFGKIRFILQNINLQLKSALKTKYLFYQTLLYKGEKQVATNQGYLLGRRRGRRRRRGQRRR